MTSQPIPDSELAEIREGLSGVCECCDTSKRLLDEIDRLKDENSLQSTIIEAAKEKYDSMYFKLTELEKQLDNAEKWIDAIAKPPEGTK